MGKFIQKGDKREVSAETRRKLSEAGSLHGGYKELRRWKKEGKYPDLRTHFGKYIRRVATQIAEDLGGMSALNMKQRILLDRVIEKLVFLERIGAWSMEQDRIVNAKGELLPALGKNYLAFSNALRLDLLALYEEAGGKGKGDLYNEWRKQFFEDEQKESK